MNRYTIAVLVRNQFGVLNRVTSLFRRRQFNISALTVSETESNDFSRITVIFEGEESMAQQLINQLYKLPDVCSVRELEGESTISRELMLVKVKNNPETSAKIRDISNKFCAEPVDYSNEAIMLQLTGDSLKLDEFIAQIREFGILEICRTGVVALSKGEDTLIGDANL